MMNDDRQRPVTLEDLLRLKRAERPPAEFWTQFDRQLRAKQLAALLEKRPWWRTVAPRLFAGFTRYQLPLGATAVLAITFFTLRDYRATAPLPVTTAPSVASELSSTPAAPQVAVSETPAIATLEPAASSRDHAALVAADSPAVNAEMAGNDSSSRDPRTTSIVARSEPSDEFFSATARTIKANLLAAHAAHPELARKFLGQARSYEARAASSRPPVVEPLAQMSLPSDVRRSRLLASALPASSPAPARIGERVSSRISQERLYDSISRYDVGGDRLSIKF